MKVSVLMTTYNHERYIAQAIESVLMQQVNFPYELIIGEDASTDRTREIVLEYQKQYPNVIRALLRDREASDRDRARGLGGKTNFVEAFKACCGDYIALLDGDDYWIEPHKLQAQVEFLTNHPDFAICFHNVERFYEDGTQPPSNGCPPNQKAISTIQDLLALNFIHSSSCMFPRGLFKEFSDWFLTAPFGDWPIYVFNAQHGKIGYIDEVMGAYRIHSQGEWSSKSNKQRTLELVEFYKHINRHLEFRYDRQIGDNLFMCWYWLAVMAAGDQDLEGARVYARNCFAALPFYKHLGFRIKLLARLYMPAIFKIGKKLQALGGSAHLKIPPTSPRRT